MNTLQVELVRTSWACIEPVADRAARLFYRRLFELSPELREQFTTCVVEQQCRFIDTLQQAIEHLEEPKTWGDDLDALRRSHEENGIGAESHTNTADALRWMLEQELGEAFRGETRAAWEEVYEALAVSD